MANKRVDFMNLRQLLLLKERGASNRNCEKNLDLHRNTVNHYVRLFRASGQSYSALLELDDVALSELFPVRVPVNKNRYFELSSKFEYFERELRKPGCTREVLWRDYIKRHPDGYSYSQFNEHFARWRERVKVSGKLIHKAGDKMYVDYTGNKMHIIDKETGELKEVEVFVTILPASQYVYAESSITQTKEDFINSMNRSFQFYGGVPKCIVTDNLKSAVTKSSKYEPVLNKGLKDLALHYGAVLNPTRAYSPQDKALVEGVIKLVYQHIFYPLSNQTFFCINSLNKAISEQLVVLNSLIMKTYGVSRHTQFIEIEEPHLLPLPSTIYELKEFKKAKVQKMGHVYLHADKNYYSVPYRFVGQTVEVQYNTTHVEVFYNGQRIASHNRSYRKGAYTTIKEHLSSAHNFYRDWSPEYFISKASTKGTHVQKYVARLLEKAQHPEVAYKQCLGIIHLDKKYEIERINMACQLAIDHSRHGYQIIRNILESKADLFDSSVTHQPHISTHDNIRGATKYY